MSQDSGQEKTEQPTAKRLNEAREKGQIARSKELNSTAILLTGAGGMLVLGDQLISGLNNILINGLTLERKDMYDPSSIMRLLQLRGEDALFTLAPLLMALVLIAFLAPMALGGFALSTKALAFKWEKLDPIKGLGKLFAWRGLVELLKALAKFSMVTAVIVLYLNLNSEKIISLGMMDIDDALVVVGGLLFWAFLFLSSTLILVTLVDVPFQLWDHNKQLMMTRQEVKDEYKETDGHPEVKQHIRNLQHQMAERRMMQDVPKADVIVTNPTHYAVALRYDQESMGAPRVVAKGADLISFEIRKVARECNIPIAEAPALTRAIFYSTEISDEIPAGLYLAVAQVLAYVFQLRTGHRYDDGEAINMPDLPIPDDLLHD